MQVERIRALADLIERQPHTGYWDDTGFSMEHWTHSCGTPSCIAGWAWSLAGSPDRSEWDVAAEYLDLEDVHSGPLFMGIGKPAGLSLDAITPSHAAAVLRHLADHGVVDWTVGVSV